MRLFCLVLVVSAAFIAAGCGGGGKHPAPVAVPAATVGAPELQGTWVIATEDGIDFPFYIGLTFTGDTLTVSQGGCRDTGPYAIEGPTITWSVSTKGSDSSCISDEDALTLEDVGVSGDRLSFKTEGSAYVFKKK